MRPNLDHRCLDSSALWGILALPICPPTPADPPKLAPNVVDEQFWTHSWTKTIRNLCEMDCEFLWFSCLAGQKICRRGTERPCYKVSYIHDSRRRLTFEDASRACRVEGGELLSIETESEQRLIERFIHQLQAADGDFWIGLRRSPERHPAGVSPVCPSQYYWLDGSKAKYRFLSPIGQFVQSSQLTQGTNLSLVLFF